MRRVKEDDSEVPLSLNVFKKDVRIVGITFNLRRETEGDEPDDRYEEYDSLETVKSISHELKMLGFQVVLFEQDERLLQELKFVSPDFVLNIAEGTGNHRGRESQVPCILESLDIPFSGSDSASLALSLDKLVTSKILQNSGISVPRNFTATNPKDLSKAVSFLKTCEKVIVKPRWEGSSKGIFMDSIVDNVEALKKCISRVWERYEQPAIVEEFLPGLEITAAVAGNSYPECIGMMSISPVAAKSTFIYSLEEKRNYLERIRYSGPDSIGPELRRKIGNLAVRAFSSLDLRDIGRIDFRLDYKGSPRVIDVNPLPGLSPDYSDLPILYRLSGGCYHDLIQIILRNAFSRYALNPAFIEEPELAVKKA